MTTNTNRYIIISEDPQGRVSLCIGSGSIGTYNSIQQATRNVGAKVYFNRFGITDEQYDLTIDSLGFLSGRPIEEVKDKLQALLDKFDMQPGVK